MPRGRSQALVIGAGPGGAAAGIELARAGVDVVVVDRARFPRPKTCGDAVSNRAVALVQGLGAHLEGTPHAWVRAGAAVLPDGTRLQRQYHSPGAIVPRQHLDDALRAALEASGARLHQGCAVGALEPGPDGGWRARGDDLDWTARFVIAADGPSSIGWSALGRVKPRGRWLGVAITMYLEDVAFPYGEDVSDHFLERELPHGYGWVFPSVDGCANVGVYQRDDARPPGRGVLASQLEAFLARHPDRFARARRVSSARIWPLPLAPGPAPDCGHDLLLVGDAAGFVDPFTGEGIWQALHSGVHAGRIAAQAVQRGTLDEELQARYRRICTRAIRRPSAAKARAQELVAPLIEYRLYRWAPVRAALTWAYARGALELTKSV